MARVYWRTPGRDTTEAQGTPLHRQLYIMSIIGAYRRGTGGQADSFCGSHMSL
jgi:hypothetical protein